MNTKLPEIQDAEVTEQNMIHFEEGLLGFEEIKEYLLYHEDDSNIIWNLQAAASSIPSFIVVDPYAVLSDYSPLFTQADLNYFGETDTTNLVLLVIAVIRPNLNDSVVNLKSPIVIDVNTKKAKQIILENSNYPIRYKLFANK
jgi:flagellar assembly factor FliW